jgi:hypothetical protein
MLRCNPRVQPVLLKFPLTEFSSEKVALIFPLLRFDEQCTFQFCFRQNQRHCSLAVPDTPGKRLG